MTAPFSLAGSASGDDLPQNGDESLVVRPCAHAHAKMASGRDPGRAIERANRESTLVQLAHEVGRIRGSQMHGASRGERAHHVIGFRWIDADPGYQAEHALHPRYLRFKHFARPFQVMIGRGQLQQARAERGGGRAFGYLGDAASRRLAGTWAQWP